VPLPAAPDQQSERIVVSAVPAASRRERTRLPPTERRAQLLAVAADIIRTEGLHAANLKRIAASASISETQAYNYFATREALFGALAIDELAKIQAARLADISQAEGHHAKIMAGTRTYLRQLDQRGGLLQMLLVNPAVREAVRENREREGSSTVTILESPNAIRTLGSKSPSSTTPVMPRLTACRARSGKSLLAIHQKEPVWVAPSITTARSASLRRSRKIMQRSCSRSRIRR